MLRNQRFKAQKAIGIQDLEDMEMRSYGKELVNEINFVSLHRQPKWLISLWQGRLTCALLPYWREQKGTL